MRQTSAETEQVRDNQGEIIVSLQNDLEAKAMKIEEVKFFHKGHPSFCKLKNVCFAAFNTLWPSSGWIANRK